MQKQEEIRLEVEKHIRACLKVSGIEKDISDSLSKSLMVLLGGLGVVIKVERELPHNSYPRQKYGQAQQDMLKAGYIATESLIKEVEIGYNST